MCIRCNTASAQSPAGLCSACTIETRIEIRRGLSQLTDYLACWAAFDDWLRLSGR
jgi:hypothetical protein